MRRTSLIAHLVVLICAGPLAAQGPQWQVIASPAAGLWFHGLALARAGGFGSLPLYDPAYAATLARLGDGHEPSPTPLSRIPPSITSALGQDSALEALHFVPLWFPRSSATAMLEALGRVAEEPARALEAAGVRERYGVQVVLAALPTPAARQALGRYVEELRREFGAGYPALAEALLPAEQVAAVTAAWRPVELALAPYLQRRGLAGGTLLLAPALGADGRFFLGVPRDPRDNAVAVRAVRGEPAEAVVFRVVRELCYPVVREALPSGVEPADPVTGERLGSAAAERCGSALLARYLPAMAPRYDAYWAAERAAYAGGERDLPLPEAVVAAIARGVAER